MTTQGGTLDGVTVNGNLDVSQVNNANLTIENSLVLNGPMLIGATDGSTSGYVQFDTTTADCTLSGNATVVFGGNSNNGLYNGLANDSYNELVGTLTLASTVTVEGAAGNLGAAYNYYTRYDSVGSYGRLINQGKISADIIGSTLYVSNYGTFQNQGTLDASNGATLNVGGLMGNLGIATLEDTGSQLVLSGTNYFVDQGLTAGTGQTITLNGSWSKLSTITTNGGTVNLGGTFTVGNLGVIHEYGWNSEPDGNAR